MIKVSKIVLGVGWLLMPLLPNHDLFNYIYSGTPLVAWKQFLAFVLLLFAFDWALRINPTNRADAVKKKLLLAYLSLGTMFVIYAYVLGLSSYRIFYGMMSYSGLAGFIYFSSLVDNEGARIKIYRAMALLTIIGSAGLFIDYYTDLFSFLPRSRGLALEYFDLHDAERRAAFLYGASTLVFPFQAFGLLSMSFICARKASWVGFISYNVFAVIVIIGIYLTGSRAAFYLMILAYMVGYRVVSRGVNIGAKYLIVTGVLTSGFLLGFLSGYDFSGLGALPDGSDRYIEVVSGQDEGNSHRFLRWSQGLELMVNISFEWFLGHGVGTTIGGVSDGVKTSTHYESSVLQAFYEGGFVLIIYRYLAAIVAIGVYVFHTRYRIREATALALYICLVGVNTAVAPTFGAYHTQMVYFLSCGLLISLCYRKTERLN